MAVGFRVVAASTVFLFLLSFLCVLKVFHNGISAELNPDASSLSLSLQTLEAHLASQKERYTVLQRQLEQLEQSVASTTGSAAATASIKRTRSLPNNVSFTQEHKLAVLVPYRDREQHLAKLVSRIDRYLVAQGRNFTIFVIEQSAQYLFNRGALLNTGFQLLEGSDYDHFAFQDVDTIPTDRGNVQYSYPAGAAPLHLTPYGIHPTANFEDFFGGITIFTRKQFEKVNGYGINFWGWGREDDNMRQRLLLHGMLPPELPAVPKRTRRFYFEHQKHKKALEWRVEGNGSEVHYYGVNPDQPYGDARIVSVQPHLMQETTTGLNTTIFWINSVQTYGTAVHYKAKAPAAILQGAGIFLE
ncbi:hypothetical protein WJX79_003213 [Trebouxia sp. C0005]